MSDPQVNPPAAFPGKGEAITSPRSIHIQNDSIVIDMGSDPKTPSPDIHAGRAELTTVPKDTYFGAINAEGQLERLVTANAGDRQVIGLLVGGWVAEGYRVVSLPRKEAIKLLRAGLPAAAPKTQDSAPAAANEPTPTPGSGEGMPVAAAA